MVSQQRQRHQQQSHHSNLEWRDTTGLHRPLHAHQTPRDVITPIGVRCHVSSRSRSRNRSRSRRMEGLWVTHRWPRLRKNVSSSNDRFYFFMDSSFALFEHRGDTECPTWDNGELKPGHVSLTHRRKSASVTILLINAMSSNHPHT